MSRGKRTSLWRASWTEVTVELVVYAAVVFGVRFGMGLILDYGMWVEGTLAILLAIILVLTYRHIKRRNWRRRVRNAAADQGDRSFFESDGQEDMRRL